MKSIFKTIRSLTVAALLGIAMLADQCRAQGLTGTFVTPRATLLWSGTLTTNTTSVTLYWTNSLNYSGFHRPQLFFSELNTNPAGTYGTATVTAYPVPYFGSLGYTNLVFGTTTVTASVGTNLISQACASLSTNIDYAGMEWPQADSIAGWKIVISYPFTNALPVNAELDGILAP